MLNPPFGDKKRRTNERVTVKEGEEDKERRREIENYCKRKWE